MKINRLNEDLLRIPNMEQPEDAVTEPVEAMPPDFAGAVNEHEKIKDKLENDFKEQEKAKEEFIKDTEKTETPKVATSEMKKMKLSESLFEDVEVVSPTVDDEEIIDKKTETPTETLTEDVSEGKFDKYIGQFGSGPCAPISHLRYWERHLNDATKHLNDEKYGDIAEQEVAEALDNIKNNLKEFVDFNSYWTKHYELVREEFSRVLEEADAKTGFPESVVEEALIDLDMPISANVTANGNTVPFLNGTSKTEEVEDELKEATAVVDRPTIAWTEDEADEGDDLWTKIYDELDASLDPQDCNREVKAKRGERYQKVHTANDGIVVYGTTEAELEFAKKVADHYGCEYTVKEDKNINTNEYYKYSLTIHMPLE